MLHSRICCRTSGQTAACISLYSLSAEGRRRTYWPKRRSEGTVLVDVDILYYGERNCGVVKDLELWGGRVVIYMDMYI